MLDTMRNPPSLLSDSAISLAQYVADTPDLTEKALYKYESWQIDTLDTVTR